MLPTALIMASRRAAPAGMAPGIDRKIGVMDIWPIAARHGATMVATG